MNAKPLPRPALIALLFAVFMLVLVGCNKEGDKDPGNTFSAADGNKSSSRIESAKETLLSLSTALEMFRVDNGRYPTTSEGLKALAEQPGGVLNWQQHLPTIPMDPWGNPYLYEFPGKRRPQSYDLSSSGPDGRPGTEDDITN